MGEAALPDAVSGPLSAGVDEAGRGALAGPLYVAAVILPEGFHHTLLRDSKTPVSYTHLTLPTTERV